MTTTITDPDNASIDPDDAWITKRRAVLAYRRSLHGRRYWDSATLPATPHLRAVDDAEIERAEP